MNNTNNNQQGASSHNNNNVNTNLGVNKANMVNALIQVAIAAACVIGVLFNVEQANAIIDHANDLSLPSTLQPTASAIANDHSNQPWSSRIAQHACPCVCFSPCCPQCTRCWQ